jgi:CBS domain-containing protein
MKVKEIMSSEVKACLPETSLRAAAELMRETNFGTLPVTNFENKVLGMITDRDICLAVGESPQLALQIKVSDVVSGKVFNCAPDDDVKDALKTMRKKRVRRLPVMTKSGTLKGILSINDVLLHAGKGNGKKHGKITYKEVMRTYKEICKPLLFDLPATQVQTVL